MRTRILFATLGIALIVSTSVQPKQTMVFDFGRHSCGVWLEIRAARNNASDVRFIQGQEWISGFVTAYNWYEHPGGNVSAGTDREGMYAWLDKYCRENPTMAVFLAVTNLIEHLRTR